MWSDLFLSRRRRPRTLKESTLTKENPPVQPASSRHRLPPQRKRRSTIAKQRIKQRSESFDHELRLWDAMPPIGREFGSPDFERLMDEDAQAGVGVFDPALKLLFPES